MISIVVPAFNEERLIKACLDSLKSQDYSGEYEIIVVDNGSTDNTAGIAQDAGAKVVPCSRKGVAYARQAGAGAASGDIIIQADADTVYPGNWLSRISRSFAAHPEAVAVAGSFIYHKSSPWFAPFEYFLRVFINLLSTVIFGKPFAVSGANFAFYKSAFLKIGGYDASAYSPDQYNIAARLSRLGKIVYSPRTCAMTSARSVRKPISTIIVDFLRHIWRFFANAFSVMDASLRRSFAGLPPSSPRFHVRVSLPLASLIVVGILGYGYFVPASPVFGKVYYKTITSQKVIALSFDDGPNEPYTSRVLDILADYDVRATFFVVGRNVELYPDTVKRMVAEGDALGNHSYSHLANHALPLDCESDIERAQKTILAVAGVLPHLYRPPHGKKTPWELQAIKKLGLIPVMWSVATNELSGKSAEELAHEIIKKARPGGIILLHDGYGTNHNDRESDKSLTVKMLPTIIEKLQTEGYEFVTIPELLNVPEYNQAYP